MLLGGGTVSGVENQADVNGADAKKRFHSSSHGSSLRRLHGVVGTLNVGRTLVERPFLQALLGRALWHREVCLMISAGLFRDSIIWVGWKLNISLM